MRTHFYHDASSYDMFRDRRVVESVIERLSKQNCVAQRRFFKNFGVLEIILFLKTIAVRCNCASIMNQTKVTMLRCCQRYSPKRPRLVKHDVSRVCTAKTTIPGGLRSCDMPSVNLAPSVAKPRSWSDRPDPPGPDPPFGALTFNFEPFSKLVCSHVWHNWEFFSRESGLTVGQVRRHDSQVNHDQGGASFTGDFFLPKPLINC